MIDPTEVSVSGGLPVGYLIADHAPGCIRDAKECPTDFRFCFETEIKYPEFRILLCTWPLIGLCSFGCMSGTWLANVGARELFMGMGRILSQMITDQAHPHARHG